MYGKTRYGLTQYADASSRQEYQDEYFQDISKYVPEFIAKTAQFKALHNVEGHEIGLAFHNLRDDYQQVFLDTATWGLNRWEEMYGIATNLSLSYEQRREIVAAKIRGQGTTTRQMIAVTAEAFSGGEVEVIEDNPNSHFIIRFIGIKGIPRNMQAFIAMLEDIKPAHLKYSFEYTYTTWNSLRPLTWNSIADKTWDGLRTMREVDYNDGTWNGFGGNTWDMVAWKTWEEIGKE